MQLSKPSISGAARNALVDPQPCSCAGLTDSLQADLPDKLLTERQPHRC